ncbi:MAG: MazG nucleotide pyrophosphohydrolase [Candidatus Woesebacteria bacterium GW2011_GWB1_39_12]|uniref:MazG nucleotide pyrophosphohydrolase n=2 Tax=Candidatus Woeseibacteriota TaxID=1752722 RepID=A0A0G0MAB6_9BACT|nr:MAG: MazG nucleotide pyrophosphohydrolase [Candidatus Woesebacteria bacterium GW2011_GWA1_39_12]KKR01776.1 MAG: MazG nucleotide pyrophosphohydrolase [Candidatus Woesebacteria bacterium GW2011_GWB1_39_12]
MDFKTLIERAKEIRKLYAASDEKRLGKEWPRGEYVKAFVGDVGALIKLTQAKEGFREIENIDERLAHEFGNILWAVIMLAEMYGIDLEKSFMETMNELKERASKGSLAKTQVRSGIVDR